MPKCELCGKEVVVLFAVPPERQVYLVCEDCNIYPPPKRSRIVKNTRNSKYGGLDLRR